MGIRSYSGRGMFGRECLAFTSSRGDDWMQEFVEAIQRDAQEAQILPAAGWSMDSMGLGSVIYNPSVSYKEFRDYYPEFDEDKDEDEEDPGDD